MLFRTGDSPLAYHDLPTRDVPLTPGIVARALLSSGSIPLVMAGVRDIDGAPGTHFDGGIIDYHFDFGFARDDRLVLFPHFFDRITPGWLDKPWKSRRPRAEALDDVVMIAPSDAFVASLPGSKVPDRDDFLDFGQDERIERWYGVIDRCRVLAEELGDAIESGRLAERVVPFVG